MNLDMRIHELAKEIRDMRERHARIKSECRKAQQDMYAMGDQWGNAYAYHTMRPAGRLMEEIEKKEKELLELQSKQAKEHEEQRLKQYSDNCGCGACYRRIGNCWNRP